MFFIYVNNIQQYMLVDLQTKFVKLYYLYILKKYIDKTLKFMISAIDNLEYMSFPADKRAILGKIQGTLQKV